VVADGDDAVEAVQTRLGVERMQENIFCQDMEK
jgi:hypothetical protein